MQSESIQRCLIPYLIENRRASVIASWNVNERSCRGIDFENILLLEEVRVITFESPQR
jgi:hypothetical protein